MIRRHLKTIAWSGVLATCAEALWLWSWLAATGAPQLPATAIWLWPVAWVSGTGIATTLLHVGDGRTSAMAMCCTLVGRVLALGLPMVVVFFALASVFASS